MQDYAVVKKDKYHKTLLMTDVAGYMANGWELVTDYVAVRMISTNIFSPDGMAHIAVPIGCDPWVVKVETMYPVSYAKEGVKEPEDIVIIGVNEPVPAELLPTVKEAQPLVEQEIAPGVKLTVASPELPKSDSTVTTEDILAQPVITAPPVQDAPKVIKAKQQ